MAATVLFACDFESLSTATQLTPANTGFSSWVINGSSVGAGNAALVTSDASETHGDMGAAFAITGTANNYGQYNISTGSGDVYYFEWSFTMPAAAPTTAGYNGWTPRFSTTENIRPRVGSDGKFIMFNTAGGSIAASQAASAYVATHKYTVQIYVKHGTTTTDGCAGVRIVDLTTGSLFHTWSATNINASTSPPTIGRFLMPLSTHGWSGGSYAFDTLRIGRSTLLDDWMDPVTDSPVPDIAVTTYGPFWVVVGVDAEGVTQTWDIVEDGTSTGKVPATSIGPIALPDDETTKAWAIDADPYTADWEVTATDPADQTDTAATTTPALSTGGGGPKSPVGGVPTSTWA